MHSGEWTLEDNPLVNAPHTVKDLINIWDRAYTQEQAVFPAGVSPANKYWPTVSRVDNVFGDRNLVCSCPSIDSYR